MDRGTTNVDVNLPLRDALARVGGGEPLHLAVGPDELTVTTLDDTVVETKVPLPRRWLRGFAEVQAIAAGIDLRAEIDAARPAGSCAPCRRAATAGRCGRCRPAAPCGSPPARARRGLPGRAGRLENLAPLLRFVKLLRVYGRSRAGSAPGGERVGAAARDARLHPVPDLTAASPARARSSTPCRTDLRRRRPGRRVLAWEPLEVDLLAERSGLPTDRVRARAHPARHRRPGRLRRRRGGHFHRELPYDAWPSRASTPACPTPGAGRQGSGHRGRPAVDTPMTTDSTSASGEPGPAPATGGPTTGDPRSLQARARRPHRRAGE